MRTPERARALAEQLVSRAVDAGASAADAVYNGDRSTTVQVRLGEIEKVDHSEAEEIGLRAFVGSRSATAATSDFSDDGIAVLVERVLAMAAKAPEDPFAGLAPETLLLRDAPPELDCLDTAEPQPAELRDRALAAEQAALAIPGVSNSAGGGASASIGLTALATSAGFVGCFQGSSHGCLAGAVAGDGASMQRDHDWQSVRHLVDLDEAESIGRRAGERAVARLNPGRVRPGRYPVLFDRRLAGSLLGHFAGAISGSAIARKASFLDGRLGQRLFREGVAIVDDPLRRRGLRSRPFDGEGLAVSRQELVRDGVLTSWIADSASARQLGIQPTGHASRSVGGAPGAAPSNLYIEAGSRDPAAIMASLPEALLVTELIGQGVNPVTGDYSRGAAGFMVRGGEIAEPVAEITIASNLIAMFASLESASDLEFRRGIDAPTLLVPEMTVGSA